jgi:hypothetical protein
MEIAIIALGVSGLAFAGIALNRARPKVIVERIPGHPDAFELWKEGPGKALIVRADVVTPTFSRGTPIEEAQAAVPGLSVDEQIVRDTNPWAKGAALEPLRRFEVRLPAATNLRIVYRADGALGTMARATLMVGAVTDPTPALGEFRPHRSPSSPGTVDSVPTTTKGVAHEKDRIHCLDRARRVTGGGGHRHLGGGQQHPLRPEHHDLG